MFENYSYRSNPEGKIYPGFGSADPYGWGAVSHFRTCFLAIAASLAVLIAGILSTCGAIWLAFRLAFRDSDPTVLSVAGGTAIVLFVVCTAMWAYYAVERFIDSRLPTLRVTEPAAAPLAAGQPFRLPVKGHCKDGGPPDVIEFRINGGDWRSGYCDHITVPSVPPGQFKLELRCWRGWLSSSVHAKTWTIGDAQRTAA